MIIKYRRASHRDLSISSQLIARGQLCTFEKVTRYISIACHTRAIRIDAASEFEKVSFDDVWTIRAKHRDDVRYYFPPLAAAMPPRPRFDGEPRAPDFFDAAAAAGARNPDGRFAGFVDEEAAAAAGGL